VEKRPEDFFHGQPGADMTTGRNTHDEAHRAAAESPAAAATGRIGLALFAVYVACYLAFMALVLFFPEKLSLRPFGGVNLAIAAGMGLIGGAIVLALLYMALCRAAERGGRG
jgi:uncharacterized membrane protein (DUF485 family)